MATPRAGRFATAMAAAALLAVTGPAQATLLGDEVGYDLTITSFDNTVADGSGTVLVGAGVEVDPIIATSPFLALDVGDSSFELVYDDAVNRAIRRLEFDLTGLDWVGAPGTVTSATFAILDLQDVAANISWTDDSVSLVIDNTDGNFFSWRIGDRLVVDITTRHVPEPGTLGIVGAGLAMLGFMRRGRAPGRPAANRVV